ncbi:MAG: SRPBCC family protein [Candidatus Dormibacteria bacterium]
MLSAADRCPCGGETLELNNGFRLPVTLDRAWALLTDLERVAPCMPGAQLLEVEGADYRGLVKVRIGPISTEYRGTAHFVELDPAAHRAVLRATGRETRGQGGASATMTAQLSEDQEATQVVIKTELEIQGKVAQFGRGMIEDVSRRLLAEFTGRLERDLLSGEAAQEPHAAPGVGEGQGDRAPAAPPPPAEPTGPRLRPLDPAPVEAIDLWQLSRAGLARRLLLPLALVLAAVLFLWRRRRVAGRSG